ncbi:condensin-2 complex subunit H2 isoform X1 [Gambusia affinis]|uniref:condensin-2 complex subunit H2 isoform X1 n=1 Tax=Gambusia affinis TaxID=33528 RepID=UPI001CDC5B99|nr:condensin-2 complex subunit H2 isoform X1 [Gambusia affinis]XP_043964337.1 condensin-2 complex subunit H2 isoform X1 [Gambusia affinis]
MESAESRYAHLLQPIRELTKNWEIDVASELNDYLEELDEMCITFDGGRTRLNFAEAALLIQGSTCIYSKKVELLHSLVFQTLEFISSNKKRSRAAAQQGAAAVDQTEQEAEDLAVFTPLELDESATPPRTEPHMDISVVPLPPEALIPPETQEKNKLPLISVGGEVLCSQKDFRVNLFLPGPDDLIVLMLQSAAASRFLLDQSAAAESAVTFDPNEAAEDFLPVQEELNLEPEPDPEEHIEWQQVSGEGRLIRRAAARQEEEEEPPPAVSNWTLHDPYAVLGGDRPLTPGRCYRVPDGLDDGGKRKRKRTILQDFRSWFRGAFQPQEPKLKVGPSFPDLNYLYLRTLRDKVRRQRTLCRTLGVVMTEEELRRTFLQLEGAGPVDDVTPAKLLGGDSDDSDAEPDGLPAEFREPDSASPVDAQWDDMTYEELVKLRVEQLVVHSQGYTQESALSRRVRDWEDKIRPELALQEDRPPFDIHAYGERIVAQLGAVGRKRSFASIVRGLDNMEACKLLLASLQLANDYSVEVDSAAGLEDSVDSMCLTLLSTQRATDRFKMLADSS